MANVAKVLGQTVSTGSTVNLYTVPALTQTVVSTLTVANLTAAAGTFSVAVRVSGSTLENKHYIYRNVSLPANDTFAATFGITMAATDIVTVASSVSSSFNLFGQEVTTT
jgi:hypothetical protein